MYNQQVFYYLPIAEYILSKHSLKILHILSVMLRKTQSLMEEFDYRISTPFEINVYGNHMRYFAPLLPFAKNQLIKDLKASFFKVSLAQVFINDQRYCCIISHWKNLRDAGLLAGIGGSLSLFSLSHFSLASHSFPFLPVATSTP